MHLVLFISFLPLCFSLSLADQDTSLTRFSGVVVNERTRVALPNTAVFLAGTTKGTVSDSSGFFRIDSIQPGDYTLVVFHSGFSPLQRVVTLKPGVNHEFRSQLRELPPRAAEKKYVPTMRTKQAERLLLGVSVNSLHSQLLNPEVLQISEVRGGMVATADQLLEIENRGLGYRIFLSLDSLVTAPAKSTWAGAVRFEEFQSTDSDQQQEWEERRQLAYEGSLRHFLRSAAQNRLSENGFDVYLVGYTNNQYSFSLKQETSHPAKRERYISAVKGSDSFQLIHTGWALEVQYFRETSKSQPQTSWIVLTGKTGEFSPAGILKDPPSVETFGYWRIEGLSEALPNKYVPKID